MTFWTLNLFLFLNSLGAFSLAGRCDMEYTSVHTFMTSTHTHTQFYDITPSLA